MSAERPSAIRPGAPAAEQPRHDVVFAAPAGEPRARRAADVFTLVVGILLALLLAWVHRSRIGIDEGVLALFEDGLPGWLETILSIVFLIGGLYPVGLVVGILLYGRGRRAIARDMVLAAALTAGVAILLGFLAGPEWPDVFPELRGSEGVPSYPLLRLAIATAVLTVAAPYLTVPMRRVGWQLLAAMTVAAAMLAFGDVSSTLGALAIGLAVAAAVRLALGSSEGVPSRPRVADALHAIGLDAGDLDYLDEQRAGVTSLQGEIAGKGQALVKVYGRDAAEAATMTRLWRWVWYRNEDRPLRATGLQQVEHEALMLLESARAGAPVPPLVGWGLGDQGDAVIVTGSTGAARLGLAPDSDVSDGTLRRCWKGLLALHRVGIAVGALDGSRIAVRDGDGDQNGVWLTDLSGAIVTPDQDTVAADLAQMLVTTAVVAGRERSIRIARDALGDDQLLDALRLLQGSVLTRELQRSVRSADANLKDLRAGVTEELGAKAPELVQLKRVTWRNVATVALTVVAAYALISSLAGIGFDTIVDQYSDAVWAWVVVALVLAQLTNVGEYISMTGVVARTVRVPFGPTMMFRYALSYVQLAIPGDAGAIAMNIRYMQTLGISTAKSVVQGPLLTVTSTVFDIVLFLIALQFVGSDVAESLNLDDLDTGPVLRLLLLAGVLVVIGAIVMLAVPRFRDRLLPHISDGLKTVRASLTDPERLLRVAAGTLFQKLLFALTLAAAVAAFGESISLAEAIFVNTVVSLFLGLMPVPGGIGVGEAGLTAGLVAVGVPEETAFSAALTHRMVTAYLPPVFGWYASRWLTARDYL